MHGGLGCYNATKLADYVSDVLRVKCPAVFDACMADAHCRPTLSDAALFALLASKQMRAFNSVRWKLLAPFWNPIEQCLLSVQTLPREDRLPNLCSTEAREAI
eukprot:COSAG05_NODE_17842_length_318_cov_0.931507_1_plen_102_part_01